MLDKRSTEGGIFISRKHSTRLKLAIVQRYLEGSCGFRILAREYNVDRVDIRRWFAAYQKHGTTGLCTTHRTYTGDFRVYVVEYMHDNGVSMCQAAANFNIPSPTTLGKWERIYDEQGRAALREEYRGRSTKMRIKKGRTLKGNIQKDEEPLAEVQRLRMENEYLKKLNALIQEQKKYENLIK